MSYSHGHPAQGPAANPKQPNSYSVNGATAAHITHQEIQPSNDMSEMSLRVIAKAYRSVCVVGLGYVGLPTAFMFCLGGYSVFGVDTRAATIEMVEKGLVADIYPELAVWWHKIKGAPEKQFSVGQKPSPADVFLITVPTPIHNDKTCNLSMVDGALRSILPVLTPNNLIVLESTVPPGTTEKHIKQVIEKETSFTVGKDIFVCFSPERVLPGNTIEELLNNDRLVGGITKPCGFIGHQFLSSVLKGKVHRTTATTAEFCKLAENTYRDVNIALANEFSLLAEDYGIDIHHARGLVNLHPRVNLHQPGIGVGGHCIAVDPWFFTETTPEKSKLIKTARLINDSMPEHTVRKIFADVADIASPKICLAGMTYKPNVGDTRESPAKAIYDLLKEKGCNVVAYDPLVSLYNLNGGLLEAVKESDYLAILVRHKAIEQSLTEQQSEITAAMRTPRIRVF
ncbi:MAG: nucleotide sugar dehydrogenase [Cyanobacteria bacterium P01_H01_bin.74]